MSNSLLQSDPDALRDSAIAVITYVRDAMNDGVKLLRKHDQLLDENQSDHRLESEIEAINKNISLVNESLKSVKLGELKMTIVAPTSAGKSTVINAIAGQDLLPSRNDAMTVLPTEIVFSREVKKPEFVLDEDLMMFLSEAWRQLHEKLQQIGLEKAIKQATENYFPRKNIIKEIFNSSVFSLAEVKESDSIQSELIKINDLLRLCGIFGITTDFLSSLSEIPRIEVPFPPELDLGLGTLVLVDTPGISEDKSLNLVNVVKERLKASSLVLVVVDFNQIEQTEPVKKLVDKIAEVKGRDRIYIIVNKIDARDLNNAEDLTTEQIFDLVKTKYEIDDPQNRVFEMSAIKGFLATNFQREKEIYQSTELRNSKSFEALGQKYYNDSWEDRKEDISLSEMDKAANKYWQKSGFADFMEKAIAPIVTDAAPKMTIIKGALNDSSEPFSFFSSCLREKKGILDIKLQQLRTEIDESESYLGELLSNLDNDYLRNKIITYVAEVSDEEIQKIISEINNIHTELINEFSTRLDQLVDEMSLKVSVKEYDEKQHGFGILTGNAILNNSKWRSQGEVKKCIDSITKLVVEITDEMEQKLMSTIDNCSNQLIKKVNYQLGSKISSIEFTEVFRSSFNVDINLVDDKCLNVFHDESFYGIEKTIPKDMIGVTYKDSQPILIFTPFYREASFFVYISKTKIIDEVSLCIYPVISKISLKLCQHLGQCLSKSIIFFIEGCLELIEKDSNILKEKISFSQVRQQEFLSINGELNCLLSTTEELSRTIYFQQIYIKQDLKLENG